MKNFWDEQASSGPGLPDFKKEDAAAKERLKKKFEERKNILIKQPKELKKMFEWITKILAWIPSIKNWVTNILGFVGGLGYFLQEYYATNGSPKWYQVVVSVVIWAIGYFTGKPGKLQGAVKR